MCAVYARLSSEKQAEAGNLQRQKEHLVGAATAKGCEVVAVVAEWASGRNEKRRGLRGLFRLVGFRDRLSRFGFRYIMTSGRRSRPTGSGWRCWTDPWRSMLAPELLVTWFAARLCGSRSQQCRRKVKEAEGLPAGTEVRADHP